MGLPGRTAYTGMVLEVNVGIYGIRGVPGKWKKEIELSVYSSARFL